MPNIVIEPYEKLKLYLASVIALPAWTGKLPGGVGRNKDGTAGSLWPLLSWRSISFGGGGPDAESHDSHRDRVEFNFWGPDEDALRELGNLLDEATKPIDEAATPGVGIRASLDSDHYRCHAFRSFSPVWQIVDWTEIKTQEGRFLRQYTKDFELRYMRRQDVT